MKLNNAMNIHGYYSYNRDYKMNRKLDIKWQKGFNIDENTISVWKQNIFGSFACIAAAASSSSGAENDRTSTKSSRKKNLLRIVKCSLKFRLKFFGF